MRSLKLACWNPRGLAYKSEEIEHLLDQEGIDLIFFSETWSNPNSIPRADFPLLVSPCQRRASKVGHYPHGVAIGLGKSHSVTDLAVLHQVDGFLICCSFKGICITGAYLPPSWTEEECLEALQTEELQRNFWSFRGPKILLGDLNCRLGALTFWRWSRDTLGNS